ncbi:TlpA family protein disulfide reductase [Sphingobacterium tabacisoli]|uniref:Thioredoxin-like domain-containing protein n=1 Tax=Sphingobacterium tabacisoli TaxID=2044855 RepID=A0ABW5L2R4_9SPHI|nr:TlpA family protein disulfide reductase [Sphingobacterium tabacisoli]
MKTSKWRLFMLSILIFLTGFTVKSVSATVKLGIAQLDSSMAYPFELKDRNGKLIRMADFKGKVVVIDFWVNRCAPCLALSEPLGKIRKYYEPNKDVVFIDINLDDNADVWKNCLDNGDVLTNRRYYYTDSLSISLSTAPEGFYHPMTGYYNMKGVPRWIIIGKKGEILERNPPRPLPEKNGIESAGSLRFKALINEYLWSTLKK